MAQIQFFRQGRIGLYEGDDLKALAKNFCRTFSLNKTMYMSLLEHLENTYAKYLADKQKQERLPSELGYSCVLTSNDLSDHPSNNCESPGQFDDISPAKSENFVDMLTKEVMDEVRQYYDQAQLSNNRDDNHRVGRGLLQQQAQSVQPFAFSSLKKQNFNIE